MAEKILNVRNLTISFKTNEGIVRAVRGIDYYLEKGETLAIVGESGSGKSVTSRAILGITAGNGIIGSGEIFYDGKDLLRISEDDFHELRGKRLAMIFQDPLSSLNPIVRVGKQLTEAMITRAKISRKHARREFNTLLKQFTNLMIQQNPDNIKAIDITKKYDNVISLSVKLKRSYDVSKNSIDELIDIIDKMIVELDNLHIVNVKKYLKNIFYNLKKVKNDYICKNDIYNSYHNQLKTLGDEVKNSPKQNCGRMNVVLKEILSFLKIVDEKVEPKFIAIAFALCNKELINIENKLFYLCKTTDNINLINEKVTNSKEYHEFINEFESNIENILKISYEKEMKVKKESIEVLAKVKNFDFINVETELLNDIFKCVSNCVNPISLKKDSLSLTFKKSMNDAIKKYRKALYHNFKMDKKNKPLNKLDIDLYRTNCNFLVERLITSYQNEIDDDGFDLNFTKNAVIEFFEEKAAESIYLMNSRIAKRKAVKLMTEVGIPEAEKRFTQYPFQFSGGMRQRIVIAIALSSEPEILVCDEPTTALDVTIQAQILELINELKEKHDLSIIFITHDLGVVANMADRIAVMYAGKIVECGTSEEIFYDPRHPYTWALLSSMPDLDTKEQIDPIPGTPPNMLFPPKGDAFADRNKHALVIDFEQEPPLFQITPTHYAATWLLHPDAPKVEMPEIVKERITRNKKLMEAKNV